MGRPPSVDPAASLTRVGTQGRAGYCFHQNGAFGSVLGELGFEVSRRHGHVYTGEDGRGDTSLNHLVLVVDGLPTDANPGGRWWADVGLGDAFRDPLPVLVGHYDQSGFDYEITAVRDDGWSFRHDRAGTFTGIEVSTRSTDRPAVEAAHASLSTAPDGQFAKLVVVQRRDATGIDTVRGCLWHRIEADGRTETELASYDEWRAALTDGTRLPLDDLDDAELRTLYDDQWAKHETWAAAGRP
jgi:arylamine N-acetyltransferase